MKKATMYIKKQDNFDDGLSWLRVYSSKNAMRLNKPLLKVCDSAVAKLFGIRLKRGESVKLKIEPSGKRVR